MEPMGQTQKPRMPRRPRRIPAIPMPRRQGPGFEAAGLELDALVFRVQG